MNREEVGVATRGTHRGGCLRICQEEKPQNSAADAKGDKLKPKAILPYRIIGFGKVEKDYEGGFAITVPARNEFLHGGDMVLTAAFLPKTILERREKVVLFQIG